DFHVTGVQTCALPILVDDGLEMFFSSATAAETALSMPRLRSIGFMPAATAFMPSRMNAWASTVAVVVPSPALSEVLEATSLTIRSEERRVGKEWWLRR